MLAHAIEAGRELIEVKRTLKHGEFGPWCAANLTFSYPTAARYMQAAKSLKVERFDPGTGLVAALESAAKRPAAVPSLDPSTAQRILKLARSANGGNEHEEAVAQDMLDSRLCP